MYRGKTINLVMPCFNEEDGLEEMLPAVPDFVDEVIVVDNNSTDRTADVARRYGAKVVSEKTPGYGAAYKAGFKAVTKDVVVTMDGDCTYPLDEIASCIDYLVDRDLSFVSGARFPLMSPESMNLTNRVGNRILTLTTELLFQKHLIDSQSGMWVFFADVLDKFSLQSDGMPLSEEIKIRAIKDPSIRFAETRISYASRVGEVKLDKWRDGIRNLLYLVWLRLEP